MTHNLEEFYTLEVEGSLEELNKGLVLSLGITQLGLSPETGPNCFNYEELINSWDGNIELPSEEVLISAGLVGIAEHNAQEYSRKRKEKYDALNQMELISDDSINGTTTHKDAILAIKAEFPKPV